MCLYSEESPCYCLKTGNWGQSLRHLEELKERQTLPPPKGQIPRGGRELMTTLRQTLLTSKIRLERCQTKLFAITTEHKHQKKALWLDPLQKETSKWPNCAKRTMPYSSSQCTLQPAFTVTGKMEPCAWLSMKDWTVTERLWRIYGSEGKKTIWF